MKKVIEELIFFGDDVKIGRFPKDTRFYYPNPPLPAAEDPVEMIRDALDHPIGAETLESQVKSTSRITLACNPGFEKFHPGHHPSYVDFWKNDLVEFTDPETCWYQLADGYADNSDYVEKYQEKYAYHGAHCLINWFWSGMALRQVQGVILAGARQPETARKIGFIPAPDLETAISMAREMKGPDATIGYPVMPPLFGAAVGTPGS